MTDHTFVGKEIPRPDAPDKAAGKAHFIHDLTRPGMLYGKIKYSEYAHAKIKSIDTSKAERLQGVRAVITGYNTPEVRLGFMKDNFALKKDKVRQFRDEVAAVAAIDPEIAQEAVDLIEVEYEELPGVFTPEDALLEGAPLVHEVDPRGKPRKGNLIQLPWKWAEGDVEKAKQESAFIVEDDFETKAVNQSCMGTAGCIAEFDLQSNLIIHAKTQIPYLAQNDFNQALVDMGLKGKNSRVIVPFVGGAFGSGLDTHGYEYIAILLAYKTGRPVKILLNRVEEFSYTSPRQPTKARISQGCDKNGKLTFREVNMILDNGAYISWGATTPTVMLMPISSLYVVPNFLYDAKVVYTNNTYCQAMRGYGNPQATYFVECSMDQLAEAAAIDPYDFRLINTNKPDTESFGFEITSCGLKECLDAAADKLDWKKKHGKQKDKARGVGMASLFHPGGGTRIYRSDGTGIIMKLDDFGNVSVSTGGIEIGQGFNSALTVTTAEALGVTPDKVTVVFGDTATCPWDVGTHASRGAFTSCNAAILAAGKAKKQIFDLAAENFMQIVQKKMKKRKRKDPDFEIPDLDFKSPRDPAEFDLKENSLFIKEEPDNPDLRIGLGELLRAAHFKKQGTMVVTEAFYDCNNDMLDPKTGKGNLSATYTWGTQAVEVEVDQETGEVKIVNFVSANDVGRVINKQTLMGQFYGAAAMGFGYALSEECKSEQGRSMNPNYLDYKIFTAPDLDFPMHVELIETVDKEGPFGAKGVGEPGLVPTAPAIANAVYDAVGVRIKSLPITPEKVLAALKAKNKK